MVTMKEVAERAGVALKTVSRVMNFEPHVRPVVRERVEAAAAELGYRPNPAARQLAANRSFCIGFVFFPHLNSYHSQLLVALAAECRVRGFHLVSEAIAFGEDPAIAIQRMASQVNPEGIVVPPPLCSDRALLDAARAIGMPCVRLACDADEHGQTIQVDERDVSRALVTHLIECGYRRIGLLAPPPGHDAARGRVSGYHDALEIAGITVDEGIIKTGDFSFSSGVRLGEEMLATADRPTAIFATNDGMALGIMAVARRLGLALPDELAIAGFDDTPASRMVFPQLTTVRQPIRSMARAAVSALVEPNAAKAAIDAHKLLLRGSTTGVLEMTLDRIDG